MKVGDLVWVTYFLRSSGVNFGAARILNHTASNNTYLVERIINRTTLFALESELSKISLNAVTPGVFSKLSTREVLTLIRENLNESR